MTPVAVLQMPSPWELNTGIFGEHPHLVYGAFFFSELAQLYFSSMQPKILSTEYLNILSFCSYMKQSLSVVSLKHRQCDILQAKEPTSAGEKPGADFSWKRIGLMPPPNV